MRLGRGLLNSSTTRRRPVDFGYAPFATEDVWRCNMSRMGHKVIAPLSARSAYRPVLPCLEFL
jgi:hypothetical protein